MQKEVLVPIADGTEELEAVTLIDVLRRAGARVTVASVGGMQVTASRGVKLVADCLIRDCLRMRYDLVALPGGMPGAEHLRDDPPLREILARQAREERWLAAICAAPAVVLAPHGLLGERRATCHPAFVDQLPNRSAADERVVVDGHLVTSRGPGTALEFALRLVVMLYGREYAESVALPLVPAPGTL
ncbi:MAG: DJ-1/PfpI family protein [Acidobacteria bacterium]|nr:DJ-1/PfpI family protein [Acidobacteriota bacterium]